MKVADKWKSLPKGWTQKSVEKFWDTMTGEAKHKVTECIKKMDGKIDDPGAFCASLADKVDPGWRNRQAIEQISQNWLDKQRLGSVSKTAGWEFVRVMPGKPVTNSMVENLVIRKAQYLGAIKGSVKWNPKPEFSKLDFSVQWHWTMKGIDPDTNEEYDIWGMLKVGLNMDRSPLSELMVKV